MLDLRSQRIQATRTTSITPMVVSTPSRNALIVEDMKATVEVVMPHPSHPWCKCGPLQPESTTTCCNDKCNNKCLIPETFWGIGVFVGRVVVIGVFLARVVVVGWCSRCY